MAPGEKTVFISYRRSNAAWALAVFQNLIQHGYDVFFDYDGIASGDFETVILENVRSRAHFLVLLTPSALERCGDPNDWLRREVETALVSRRNVVPLMLEGFDFGSAGIDQHLTGELNALRRYNALRVPMEYFDEAMERLRRKFLSIALEDVPHPASSATRRAAEEQQAAAKRAAPVGDNELKAQEWFEKALQTEDIAERIRLNTEAIRLKPDYAVAFHNRGGDHWRAKDYVAAWNDYTEAIRLNPKLNLTFECRGKLLLECGDADLALADYNEAVRLDPQSSNAYCGRGKTHNLRRHPSEARQDFDEAIRLNRNNADAFWERGHLIQEMGDLEGALRDYDRSIVLVQTECAYYNSRALVRWQMNDLNGAFNDFTSAIEIEPDNAYLFSNRGRLRQCQGDQDGAARDFTEAIRLLPDDPSTVTFLRDRAKVHIAMGERRKAKADESEATRIERMQASHAK